MPIILADETALAFWRRRAITSSSLLAAKPCRLARIPDGSPSADEVLAACEPLLDPDDAPHVLVATKKELRRDARIVHSSFSGPLPRKALHKVDDGLYVTGPEFTFLRLALKLPLVPLVKLGYEMAGSFVPNTDDLRGFSSCEPLLSSKGLSCFLDHAGKAHGLVRARQAARHVLDDAASPMEAEVAMLLSLPRRLGGYGLPHPVLNHPLDLSTPQGSRLKRGAITVDFAWPDRKLVLEYDSDQFHTGADKIAADSKRRNDIELLGYDIQTITSKEVADVASMDRIARTIATKLKARPRKEPDGFADKQASLRRTLISLRSKGPFV